jgi:photosystem II stability/assembly factor-like uncharacterized protein
MNSRRILALEPYTQLMPFNATWHELVNHPDELGALLYTFDLGDNWEHYIELQDTHQRSLDDNPTVVSEQGSAPSQYRDLDDDQ